MILTKQVFKWGHAERKLREYRLVGTKIPKAKAKPQPCFMTDQVELIIANTEKHEKVAFAVLGYEGLRIGELEQLLWIDVNFDSGELGMLHIRRGGSSGTTKNKDHRFVPIHPRVRSYLEALPKTHEQVLPGIRERQLLKRLKEICKQIGLTNPNRYKLHSFRHHFASLCANHHVAYRKALAWLGHRSSDILDLYYHLHDADSQATMKALADDGKLAEVIEQLDDPNNASNKAESKHDQEESDVDVPSTENVNDDFDGTLRAIGESAIEKPSENLWD